MSNYWWYQIQHRCYCKIIDGKYIPSSIQLKWNLNFLLLFNKFINMFIHESQSTNFFIQDRNQNVKIFKAWNNIYYILYF